MFFPADTEVEALKEEVAKIKMKENQTTGSFHTLILTRFVKSTNISSDMAAEVETLMEEVTKLKTKDNQTSGFLHIFVHSETFC